MLDHDFGNRHSAAKQKIVACCLLAYVTFLPGVASWASAAGQIGRVSSESEFASSSVRFQGVPLDAPSGKVQFMFWYPAAFFALGEKPHLRNQARPVLMQF